MFIIGLGLKSLNEKARIGLMAGFCLSALIILLCGELQSKSLAQEPASNPIFIAEISGTINPATHDYVKAALARAHLEDARLFVLKLNTPGGLVTSMQGIVSLLLEAKIPTVVFVTPSGGHAISAGMFITLAGHFSVMAPGTQIGAAHPVSGSGQDITGDMRAKIENTVATLAKSVAEQRGKNVEWAEIAVRESVAITDREALEKGVIDFIAADMERLLDELEGKTITVGDKTVTLSGLDEAPRTIADMSLRQKIINILADPNLAILLGLAALLGIGMELYSPGGILPGVVGVICLVLALTASSVIPLNYGGVALLFLGVVLFGVELMMPSFGIWGASGIACLVIGALYAVETGEVFGVESFAVNKVAVGGAALFGGLVTFGLIMLLVKDRQRAAVTGREGMIGRTGTVRQGFSKSPNGELRGKIFVAGELWNARLEEPSDLAAIEVGDDIQVVAMEPGMTLLVQPVQSETKLS